jgi:isopenicillin N synthase-like dioxygenase
MLDPHRPLVESFMRSSHSLVSFILTLLNARLSLPEAKLTSLHRLSALSGDQVRFIRAPPQPQDDRRVALGAHTDFGSVTILFNRIGGLQVKLPRNVEPLQLADATLSTEKNGSSEDAEEKRWVYVRPLPGHAIVNLGDAMVKFTAGILRSNIHRVAAPPGAQAAATRYSLVYFARPEDDVLLTVLRGSPLIDQALRKRVGHPGDAQEEAITSKEWILRRALGRRNGDKWEQTLGTEDRDEVGIGYR